ncbi:MAG: M1 family aminopeptidase [Candidatus Bipolaricaulaceae bacterium]
MKALLLLGLGLWASAAPISYVLTLKVAEQGTLEGSAQVTFPCPGSSEFVFRLYPNHFGPFLSVTGAWAEGAPASWEALDPTVLVVRAPLPCPQTATLALAFAGVLPEASHGYGIFWRQERTLTLAQFYPLLAPWDEGWRVHPTFPFGDNLVAEAADYVLTLNAPVGWIPVGSGEEEELGPGLWRLAGENLRELGLVLVRGFEEERRALPGVRLRAVFPPGLRLAAERALAIAAEALALFTARLGPYPYPDLDLVFVPLVGAAGVEYPRLILIDWGYAADPERDFFAEIVAHELAHQWWYGEVGTDQVAEPWLDEGLATYTSGLYFEARGELGRLVEAWRARWAQAKVLFPRGSVGCALWEFAGSPNARRSYSGYAYSGAALFLHEVRTLLGDAAFFGALRRFREEHRWGLAEASQFLALLRAAGGPAQAALEDLIRKFFGR